MNMKKKYKILILLLVLFLLISIFINFYLINNSKKQITHNNNNNDKDTILKENIVNLKDKIKDLDSNQQKIESNIDKIISNINNCNEAIVKLQNQTKEGQNNNIKIIISLIEIRDYSIIGKNFSETLNIVENLTKNNDPLHTVILKFYDYKNDSITNSEIVKSFLTELDSIKTTEKNDKSIKNFVKNNVRLTKASDSTNVTLVIEQFKELLNRNEYKDAIDLLYLNKNINNFENTIKLLSRKFELALLLKETFDIIYNQN